MAKMIKITCNGPGKHVNDVDVDKLLQQYLVVKERARSSEAVIPDKLTRHCNVCTKGRIVITREMIETLPR